MVNTLKREKHRTKVDTAEHAPQLSMTNAAPNELNPNMYYPEAQMPSICFGCVVHHNIYLALSSLSLSLSIPLGSAACILL